MKHIRIYYLGHSTS